MKFIKVRELSPNVQQFSGTFCACGTTMR